MSTFTVPNANKQIRQVANSAVLGELVESYGLDLTNSLGKIRTGKVLTKVKDVTDDVNFDDVVALAIYGSSYYCVTTNRTYSCSVLNDPRVKGNWSLVTGIAATGIGYEADAVVFDGKLLISQDTDITSWDNSVDDIDWWDVTIAGTALTTGFPHMMHVHRGGQETLFVTDKNLIRYYNATGGHSTVTLQSDFVACCVSSGVSATWVGTYTESNTNAFVYEIYVGEQLGGAPVARAAYEIDGRAVLSIQVVNNIPYIVTDKGHIQAFNGSGFVTVASFPFAYTTDKLEGVRAGSVAFSSHNRPIHPKGLQAHNGSLFILLVSEIYNGDDYVRQTPAGIWEFNQATGVLNHRAAIAETDTSFKYMVGNDSGPLMIINTAESFFLAGFKGDSLDYQNGLFAEGSSQYGYFVTSEHASESIQDAYESLYLKAKTLTGGATINTKFRTTLRDRQFLTGAWVDATTLNIVGIITVEEGDEVTILSRLNSGKIAHVVSVSYSATITSIVLDESHGVAATVVYVGIQNFKPVLDAYTSNDGEFKRISPSATGTFIQYKVELDGNVEFRQLISKGNSKTEL